VANKMARIPIKDGINWSNFQMVVNRGSEGTYDTTHAYHPCVIKDGSTYKMWYTGFNGTTQRVIYCTSTDGINWSNFQMVVDRGSEGTYDTTHAYDPYVIKDGNTYKMWYSGGITTAGTIYRIIYCTSTDGINWSNFQMVVDVGSEGTYDTTRAYDSYVIKDDNLYKMWYTGHDGTYRRTIYCTSTDGINWSNFQMVVDRGSEGTYDTTDAFLPCVIKDDNLYKMWYTGYDGTYCRTIYCTSTDGINWSNFQMVVDVGSEGTYDIIYAYDPCIIKDDNEYKIWYSGYDGTYCRIIYCTSFFQKLYYDRKNNIIREQRSDCYGSRR
jgi:predicted GH43/DUF377 family glycosyl hydrolase